MIYVSDLSCKRFKLVKYKRKNETRDEKIQAAQVMPTNGRVSSYGIALGWFQTEAKLSINMHAASASSRYSTRCITKFLSDGLGFWFLEF